MNFIGALNFYTKFIEKFHINGTPLFDLLHESTLWTYFQEHETFCQKLKNALPSDTELTIPKIKHPFFITVDAFLFGLGAVLSQLNKENKIKVIPYNSRTLTVKNRNFQHSIKNYSV